MTDLNFKANHIARFEFWVQKVLPCVYDDALSYYEVLSKIVSHLNSVVDKTNEITDLCAELDKELEAVEAKLIDNAADIDTMKQEIERIKRGDYVELYLDSISNWIDKNLIDVIGRSASFIVFGLSDDGYFVAYVPEGWDFINFDTDADYYSENYGKLILEY